MKRTIGSKVGISVIGLGARLRELIPQIPGIGSEVDIVAVNDIDRKAAAGYVKERHPDAALYDSYPALLADPNVDWVMIGSWNASHTEHVVAAAQAGKDIFCEKPVATTVDDHLRIATALQDSGSRFMLGFALRYSPHYRRIKELLEQDAIGTPVSLEFNETLDFNHGGYIMSGWRRLQEHAGPHLLEKCCHDFDVVNWLLEDRAVRVASFGDLNIFQPQNRELAAGIAPSSTGAEPYRSWLAADDPDPFSTEKDIVDNQVAILQFSRGTRATFHTNLNAAQPERRLYLVGTRGSIRADVLTGTIMLRRVGFDTVEEDRSTGARGMHGGGDPVLCDHLASAMCRGETPITGLREGIESAVVCLAIDQARTENRIVQLESIWKGIDEQLIQ